MKSAMRLCAAALIAALATTQVEAADLAPTPVEPPPPPASPSFYLHVGALGAFFNANAQSTGGGYFNNVAGVGTISNVAIRPNYTVGLELDISSPRISRSR